MPPPMAMGAQGSLAPEVSVMSIFNLILVREKENPVLVVREDQNVDTLNLVSLDGSHRRGVETVVLFVVVLERVFVGIPRRLGCKPPNRVSELREPFPSERLGHSAGLMYQVSAAPAERRRMLSLSFS